jgi:hypothetical protein
MPDATPDATTVPRAIRPIPLEERDELDCPLTGESELPMCQEPASTATRGGTTR